jgi:general secretion pathway protein G
MKPVQVGDVETAAAGTQARNRGLTLLELMIVVLIVGILGSVAIPKFGEVIQKACEGSTKGNLGAIRSALDIYFGDMETQYPSDLAALTVGGRYLTALPDARIPNYHADTSVVTMEPAADDRAGWAYDNVVGDGNLGAVWINCTHTDLKGNVWTTY